MNFFFSPNIKFNFALSIVFFMLVGNVFSQSTDLAEEFLEGLPPSIRAQVEVQNEVDDERNLEELFSADTSLEKNKVILARLQEQLTAVKQRFADLSGETSTIGLERFGNLFFQSIQSSFMPINIPNVSSSYVLDVGDNLNILMTGTRSEQLQAVIERDGSIIIPQLGKLFIAGKSIDDADQALKAFIKSKAVGVEGYLSLHEMRDVQILMLGGVETVGIFTLPGGSNILSALNAVGGISENGSFRHIEHKRNGEILKVYDLYDIFVDGNYILETSLRTGDVIFVRPKSFEVPITGGISYPAIFEMLEGETIKDAIEYAGGFSEGFYGYDYVQHKRTSLDSGTLDVIKTQDLMNVPLNPRDIILVPSFQAQAESLLRIQITGHVNRPGIYYLDEKSTLKDIISKAGGYKEGAYTYGAALFRENATSLQKTYSQKNYADTINYLLTNLGRPGSGVNRDILDFMAEELRSTVYSGRVVTDFSRDYLESPNTITLQDNDRIVIPRIQKLVYLFGEFNMPTTIEYQNSLLIEDYIESAGGLNTSSSRIVLVIDPNGRTSTYNTKKFKNFFNEVQIYPGSVIYAPKEIGQLEGIQFASSVAPILSSLALTLASLNSISN
jgi:protein involved in polysaccharide export with SLBB domain